jgi:hypothetical protein
MRNKILFRSKVCVAYIMYFLFKNTLSLLSRQIIQQFLDELVWRERWGPVPSQAFDSIIAHMAEQTKLDTGKPYRHLSVIQERINWVCRLTLMYDL